MNTLPVIYVAHPVTGEFVGTGFPDPDPLDAENWLIPAHAYLDAPPKSGDREIAVRRGGAWELLPDYRGHIYFTADGVKHEIREFGAKPPIDALDKAPPPSVAELAAKRRAELVAELTATDAASARPLRAIAIGTATDADRAKLEELDSKATVLRAELSKLK